MFDLDTRQDSHLTPAAGDSGLRYQALGQTQAQTQSALAHWLTLSLDHVGRGMVLVSEGGQVLHANRLARQALGPNHPMLIEQGRLRCRDPHDDRTLTDALQAALRRSLRRMLDLGGQANAAKADPATDRVSVAVLPIEGSASHGGAALVSLPQPSRCHDLAVQCFARQHGFTSAETSVLEALLAGQTPGSIARCKGVALCTVRTQVGQLRFKTGAHSIRQLLDRVGALPPMMGVVG